MAHAFDHARRRLLTGRRPGGLPPVRPPWSSEASVLEACEHCGACAEACPESIIVPGDGGFPEIDFHAGECTFCRACADVCPAPVFALLPGVEVAVEEGGKIIVVLEGPDSSTLGARLAEMALMDGVLGANMVYERVETP